MIEDCPGTNDAVGIWVARTSSGIDQREMATRYAKASIGTNSTMRVSLIQEDWRMDFVSATSQQDLGINTTPRAAHR